jgi:hypothetical protein
LIVIRILWEMCDMFAMESSANVMNWLTAIGIQSRPLI